MANDRPEGVKLIITVVERGQGRDVAALYTAHQVPWHYHSIGRGTAPSELLDVLGLGGTERDILFSLGSAGCGDRLMKYLDENYLEVEAKGIAMMAALSGLNNIVAAALARQGQSAAETGENGTAMDTAGENSLIFVIVNNGHTDDVMNTARAAGARGGTIIRSRYAGEEDVARFYGITVQGEKEIILIAASGQTRNTIMEMINVKHGLKTPAGAVIMSVPLDNVIRFG
ncbi:MAG: hypothetical protein LUE21_02815 [Oscillospiraceae bacterium]|nr:hypothetical protein [Oscillospiraceae bacterium]